MPNARQDSAVVWWVYIAICERDLLYIGISPDPIARLAKHRKRSSAFSQMRRPQLLLACLPVGPHRTAAQEEYSLKKKSRTKKLEWAWMARRTAACQLLIQAHGSQIFSDIVTLEQMTSDAPSSLKPASQKPTCRQAALPESQPL